MGVSERQNAMKHVVSVSLLEAIEAQAVDMRQKLQALLVAELIKRAGGLRAAAREAGEHPSNFVRLKHAKHLPTSATLRRLAEACDRLAPTNEATP